MVLVPWLSTALLSALLWWPGGWPGPVVPELLGCLVVLAALPGPRGTLWLLVPVACGLLQAERHLGQRLPAEDGGRDYIVRGQVCDFPRQSGRAVRFPLYLDAHSRSFGLPARSRLAWYESGTWPRAGETWELVVRLRPPRSLASPGAHDGERSALVADIGARGYVRQSPVNRRVTEGGWRCPTLLFRRWVADRVTDTLGEHPAGRHLLAIVVGTRHELTTEDWDLLRHTGTAHLMAISGLHIGLFAGGALLAGRLLAGLLALAGRRVRAERLSIVCALLAAVAYAALAGFALPTRRALLMLLVWATFSWAGRGANAWLTLSVALWLVLVTDGLAVLTAGFWLSFGAVIALLTATFAASRPPPASRWFDPAVRLCLAQWRVFVGLLPILATAFGELALISPIANLAAVPVFGFAVMPLAAVGLVLSTLGAWNAPLQWAAGLLAVLLDGLRWIDAGSWPAPSPPGWYLPCVLIAVAALLWPRPLPGRTISFGLLILLPMLGSRPPPSDGLQVWVLDVGQGLAVVVRTRGHTLVYDTGPAFGSGDAGRAVVLPMLRRAGIRRLDAIVISHGDLDHAGGLASVYAENPGTLVLAPEPGALPVPARPCTRGQAWTWEGVEFRMLHPGSADLRRAPNDRSCVLLVTAPGVTVLLPGDISRRAEARIARDLPARGIDLLVAPHHGSATSSSPVLVASSRARYVVFSAGYRNRWGFPRPEVVRRWRKGGACLLNTANEGTLRFGTDDAQLRLEYRHRRDAARGWTMPAEVVPCNPADATL